MNIKYTFSLFSLFILLNTISAQKAHFGYDIGYGTYKMSENKQFIKYAMSANVLGPHCVSDFPGYLFFRPYLEIEFHYFNIGMAYTLLSTGSRYSIHDYSGDYKFDSQIKGNSFSAFAEIPMYSYNKLKFLIAAESGIIFNKMKIKESFQLQDAYNQQDDYNYESVNFFYKPYLKVEYEIWKRIRTNIIFGYHKNLKANEMNLVGDEMSESAFVSNWDGIRTSIGITYKLY